jgi:SpoVK/Ycf46/Vps4 family AAA+-type ATPase
VVLVDEIESLAGSRTSVAGSEEPSDAMQAANALLMSLDCLCSLPNVLVLATSNLASSVDVAFLDCANPILEARYEILKGCLME